MYKVSLVSDVETSPYFENDKSLCLPGAFLNGVNQILTLEEYNFVASHEFITDLAVTLESFSGYVNSQLGKILRMVPDKSFYELLLDSNRSNLYEHIVNNAGVYICAFAANANIHHCVAIDSLNGLIYDSSFRKAFYLHHKSLQAIMDTEEGAVVKIRKAYQLKTVRETKMTKL